jgi:UDP-glucose 4-epimerase
MKVLIIGGSGFVGSHIVDKFLSEKWEVTVFDMQRELYRPAIEGIIFEQGDISNKIQLESVVARRFDVIIHSVSTTTPKSSNDNPEFDITSNLLSTVNLLDICTRHKVGKLIYLSSGGSIYGDADSEQQVETDPVFPICSYAITKLAAEKYLYMYEKIHGLNYSVLRISNPYGPRQNPVAKQGVISVFLHKILSGEKIEIWGDGSSVRDYIYVTDVAAACFQAANNTKNGIYNIGSNIGISVKEMVGILEKETNITPQLNWLPERGMDVSKIVLNCESAEKSLRWRPTVPLEAGLKKTIAWLNAHLLIVT